MRKWWLAALLPGALAILLGGCLVAAGPAARTRMFFGLQRNWAARWPLGVGKALPSTLESTFRPFVPIWFDLEPGVRMLLDPDDFVSREILRTGTWEPENWLAIREHLQNGATFVDVGAHVGSYSLRAARVVGAHGRVIAVEPNPDTVRKLRTNVHASGADAIVAVQPVACYDSESTLDLFAAAAFNTGESSLSRGNASQAGPPQTKHRVRARRLDDIIREVGPRSVDVVKIDVEGAEYRVLKGSVETLDRYHPIVIVEIIDFQLAAMGSNPAQVFELLRSHGYALLHSYGSNGEFAFHSARAGS